MGLVELESTAIFQIDGTLNAGDAIAGDLGVLGVFDAGCAG